MPKLLPPDISKAITANPNNLSDRQKLFLPESIASAYAQDERPMTWPVEPELNGFNELPAVKYRNHFVRTHLSADLDHLLSVYININLVDLRNLLSLVANEVLRNPLQGFGLELGAGTGAVSATLCSLYPGIHSIIAVELCEEVARGLIPAVSKKVLGDCSAKVVPVIGSFNCLPIVDRSVDFIVEMGSFHHSSDLAATFTAAYRVLKPGGTLLCLDRCHPDTVNDEEVSRMLDVQYSPDFLRSHGYPEGIMLTRRENGEHEYRLREWLAAADEAGFVQGRLISLRHVPLKRAMRGLLSLLPEYLRRYLYRTEDASPSLFFHWLRHLLRLSPKGSGLGTIYLAKKNLTVLTFYKPSGGPDDEI